jgi:hypothetical protein
MFDRGDHTGSAISPIGTSGVCRSPTAPSASPRWN